MIGDDKVEASFLLFFLKSKSAEFATLIMMTMIVVTPIHGIR